MTSTTSSGASCTCLFALLPAQFQGRWLRVCCVCFVACLLLVCARSDAVLACEKLHAGLGVALLRAGDYWRDQPAVRADMELEAQRDPFIKSNLAMLRARSPRGSLLVRPARERRGPGPWFLTLALSSSVWCRPSSNAWRSACTG